MIFFKIFLYKLEIYLFFCLVDTVVLLIYLRLECERDMYKKLSPDQISFG